MEQARFLLRVAAVASSMLLVTGFVSFRAGVLNRFLSSPAHAGISYEDSLQDVVFKLNSLAFLEEFDETPQPFVIAAKTWSESTNTAPETNGLGFELHPNTPAVPTAANQTPIMMGRSDSLVGSFKWPVADGQSNGIFSLMLLSSETIIGSERTIGPVIALGLGSEVPQQARQEVQQPASSSAEADSFTHPQNKPAAQTNGQRTPTMMAGSKSLVGIVPWPVDGGRSVTTSKSPSARFNVTTQVMAGSKSTVFEWKALEVYFGPGITAGSGASDRARPTSVPGSGTAGRMQADAKPQSSRPPEVMSGSKTIVLEWKRPAPGMRPLILPADNIPSDDQSVVVPLFSLQNFEDGSPKSLNSVTRFDDYDKFFLHLTAAIHSDHLPARTMTTGSKTFPATEYNSKGPVADVRPLKVGSLKFGSPPVMSGSKSLVIGWEVEMFAPNNQRPPGIAPLEQPLILTPSKTVIDAGRK